MGTRSGYNLPVKLIDDPSTRDSTVDSNLHVPSGPKSFQKNQSNRQKACQVLFRCVWVRAIGG